MAQLLRHLQNPQPSLAWLLRSTGDMGTGSCQGLHECCNSWCPSWESNQHLVQVQLCRAILAELWSFDLSKKMLPGLLWLELCRKRKLLWDVIMMNLASAAWNIISAAWTNSLSLSSARVAGMKEWKWTAVFPFNTASNWGPMHRLCSAQCCV